MEMNVANWITLLTGLIAGLGIGSICTALIQHSLKLKEAARQSQRQDLEGRYRVIILLMYAASDFKGEQANLRKHRSDLETHQDVLDELKTEWHNMLLFASGDTLRSLHSFIASPDENNLKKTAISMRKDLNRYDLSVAEIEKLSFN